MNWTIELCCGILLTSFTGSIFFLVWYPAGRGLEKAGLAGVRFALLKITAAGFLIPAAYLFLKSKAVGRELGHGYLFAKTYGLFLASRIFLAVWILGMGIGILRLAGDAWLLHRRLRSRMPCEKEVCARFEEVYNSLGGRGPRPQLFYSYCFAAPCICGILHPKVILPARRYGTDELQVIFTHEITHYLQGDMFLKGSVLLLRAIHFFNPLAWLLCRETEKWSEYACDIRSCRAIGGAKRYFQVIADMALYSPEGVLAAQLAESKNELVERIEKIKRINRNRKAGLLKKLAALTAAGAVFAWGSVSVYGAAVRSAEGYAYLYHLTDAETEKADMAWLNDREEYLKKGAGGGVVVRAADGIIRSQASFQWTVEGGELVETKGFSCEKGDILSLNMGISPEDVKIKVGIIEPDGSKMYIWGEGKETVHQFALSSAGEYKVFVENETNTTVEIACAGERVIDCWEEVVKRDQPCTICGYRMNLYQRIYRKERVSQNGAVGSEYRRVGPVYSNHACYNSSGGK